MGSGEDDDFLKRRRQLPDRRLAGARLRELRELGEDVFGNPTLDTRHDQHVVGEPTVVTGKADQHDPDVVGHEPDLLVRSRACLQPPERDAQSKVHDACRSLGSSSRASV